ncbi:MAG: murein biosynthesis integral membrane protein MurJ [Dethiosulfovibrio peptidovorans]|nr:MAG: murein biosynthesis integral membrane protein MurJ [Dethiosulfovibrio peptidovorans]
MSSSLSRMVRNALTMMIGTLTSRVLGLVREIITAALFGASRGLDAFYVAYTLSNIARQLLAEGALSAAFVPVFTQAMEHSGRGRGRALAQQALTVLLLSCLAVIVLGIMMSPWLVNLMAPGFDREKAALAVSLTRWMFPYLLLVSVAALAMGVLNSLDRFFVPAVAPALSNIAYIMVVLLGASRMGVWSLVWAVLFGGLLQMALQVGVACQEGIALVPAPPDRGDRDLRRMLALFLPYAAGLSLNQINPVISRVLGSFLQDGAISILNYANRVIQLPLGLVVIAISQAVLPELSRCLLRGEEAFVQTVRDSVRFALFAILPITLGACLVASPVVHLLFYRGAFDKWAWENTAQVLTMYALGLPGMACTTVIMRALYASKLPKQAIVVTVSSVAATLGFSVLLLSPLGVAGLALASSLAFSCSAGVGIVLLRRSLDHSIEVFQVAWVIRMIGALGALYLGAETMTCLWSYPVHRGLGVRSLWFLIFSGVGALAYLTVAMLMRFPELVWIREACTKKKKT